MVVAQPAGALPGIDVSHHQGLIDWSQVAGSGQRFAFAKAKAPATAERLANAMAERLSASVEPLRDTEHMIATLLGPAAALPWIPSALKRSRTSHSTFAQISPLS